MSGCAAFNSACWSIIVRFAMALPPSQACSARTGAHEGGEGSEARAQAVAWRHHVPAKPRMQAVPTTRKSKFRKPRPLSMEAL